MSTFPATQANGTYAVPAVYGPADEDSAEYAAFMVANWEDED